MNIRTNIDDLFREFCYASGFTEKELKSKSRKRDLVYARSSWAFIAHGLFDSTLGKIGEFINRDHSTVHRYYDEIRDVKEKYQFYIEIKTKLNL